MIQNYQELLHMRTNTVTSLQSSGTCISSSGRFWQS